MGRTVCVLWALLLAVGVVQGASPHILFVVADDLGRNDIGWFNNKTTLTPALDSLLDTGIFLDSYYTFKICSPTRASIHTGRYPWGIGWYDMSTDMNHCTANYTILPELLRRRGYATHALGKWDIGVVHRECTATQQRHGGYDTFYGYYEACLHDFWYHGAPFGLENCGKEIHGTDLSNSTKGAIRPAPRSANGTYDAHLFTSEAVRLIHKHDTSQPMFMYLAYQNVHLACGGKVAYGIQAPCSTVEKYPLIATDLYKVQAAMTSELDIGVGAVVDALKERGMWENTLVVFVSDNGGPLSHTTNYPLRGGKHTFWEGGLRVVSFVSGPVIPAARRGSVWHGMMHSSDWYRTLVEGAAGGDVPVSTGPREPDGKNLWSAIMGDADSPRTEVVHQVNNTYFDEGCQAIRVGNFKLIRGTPGDDRIMAWPANADHPVPFGSTGGVRENGTDHCRANGQKEKVEPRCNPYCLFNVADDISESNDLSGNPQYADKVRELSARLDDVAKSALPDSDVRATADWEDAREKLCAGLETHGTLQPIDWSP